MAAACQSSHSPASETGETTPLLLLRDFLCWIPLGFLPGNFCLSSPCSFCTGTGRAKRLKEAPESLAGCGKKGKGCSSFLFGAKQGFLTTSFSPGSHPPREEPGLLTWGSACSAPPALTTFPDLSRGISAAQQAEPTEPAHQRTLRYTSSPTAPRWGQARPGQGTTCRLREHPGSPHRQKGSPGRPEKKHGH